MLFGFRAIHFKNRFKETRSVRISVLHRKCFQSADLRIGTALASRYTINYSRAVSGFYRSCNKVKRGSPRPFNSTFYASLLHSAGPPQPPTAAKTAYRRQPCGAARKKHIEATRLKCVYLGWEKASHEKCPCQSRTHVKDFYTARLAVL